MAMGKNLGLQTGMTPMAFGPQAIKPPTAIGGNMMPGAQPPAGLPPPEYAIANKSLKPKPIKGGPLNAQAPRRITPADPNQARMTELMGATQPMNQTQGMSSLDVAGIDPETWAKMLAQYGVFA